MLSTITRSSYICAQCRYRILRGVPPRLLRLSPITSSRRNISTFPTSGPPEPEPRRGGAPDDDMDFLVDSFIENAFSGTSLPPRPAPGIGKTQNYRRVLQALPDTWEEAGVRPVVAKALSNAYPNTIRPTDIQKRIVIGLKSGNSVAVRDLPGTGKSFSIAAWVLGLERAMRWESVWGWSPTTTAFIFVPNADLGIQYYQMIRNLLQASSSLAITSSLDSFVQLLHRRVSEGESQSQMELLSEKPNPHIIIITPETAMDIISDKCDSVNGLLDFSQATAFVLDEFDALIPRTHPTLSKRLARNLPRIPNLTPPLSSAEQLLDWVFGRRRAEALARQMDPIQPQLVLSSATLSTSRIAKFIQFEHPLWIGYREGSSPTTNLSPYDLPKASRLLPIGDESSGIGKIVRSVADNILHHAVAYDISSGFMRDAPIPRTEHWTTGGITQKLEELRARGVEHAESKHQARVLKKELGSLTLLPPESWDMSNSPAKRAGYPPEIAAEALRKLLEHDKWPRNAIAAIGREAGARVFIAECSKLGIDARELTVDNWNRDMEKEGRIPIGRTDMLFDPGIRKYYKERNERDACRDATIVWVATSASLRGLDVPGVFHLYVLHRIEKAREYTTYCGRVARWPFSTIEKDIRDPRSLGIKVRRGVGKVVNLLLEDHIVPTSGLEGSSVGHQIIINDGSDRANWSWLEEGLMVAKIGCHFQDYYGKADECPCGPEVRTPKLIRPVAPSPTPNQNFNLLDAAFGPDPLQESSFSDPLKGSSSDQIPRDPSEPPPEQPKRVSKKAQLKPSTDLPDLPDMWSLPFPDGSRKPRELRRPNRNSDDGGDESLWPALKDSASPPQTPDPIFRSPEEDFRTGQRSHHAQESEASTGANSADGRYWEPLTKSRRGQGRGPGKSEASERVSTFIMDAVGELDPKHKSPQEQFRPDLKGDSGWEEEAKWLSLTAIDAEEGCQDPLGTFKATVQEFDRNRTERPGGSNQNWEKDFIPTLAPFGEVGVEPSESEKKAERVEGKKEEEKKAKKKKAAKAQGQIAEVDMEERKPKKKKVAKAQGETAEANTEKRKPKKKKVAKAQGETAEADTERRKPGKKKAAKAQGEIAEVDIEKRKPKKKKVAKAQGETAEADTEKRKPEKKKAAKTQGETAEVDTEKRKPKKKKVEKAQGETAEADTEKRKPEKKKAAKAQGEIAEVDIEKRKPKKKAAKAQGEAA